MTTFRHILLLLIWLIFIANQLLIQTGQATFWMRSYVDDVLVMPLILGTFLMILQIKKPLFTLPIRWTIISIIIFAIYFEWLLPNLSVQYTSDWKDILCYTVGGCFFVLIQNKKKKPVGTPFQPA